MLKRLIDLLRPRQVSELERFQNKLLSYMYAGLEPDLIKKMLLNDKKIRSYHDYIQQMDPDALFIESKVVKRWANKDHQFG